MNTILTDDEIATAIAHLYAGPEVLAMALPDELHSARAVEAAVLAKLERQEPVGTAISYLTEEGHTKWTFQPSQSAWAIPRDDKAAERGARSCFDVYTHPAPQQADRHALQAQGKHPAPCAKFCESKAYEIDARSLRAQIEVLEHYRKVYGQVSGILAYTAEVGPIEPGDEITVRRLKMLVADLHTYVQRCQAKDALLRQALEALETDDWQKKLQAAIDIRNHTSPKGATQ